MTNPKRWPCKLAAISAVTIGTFLLLGGGGHLNAILKTTADQPFDYRFVSLITISGILMLPGIVSIVTSYWLWLGKNWAYVSCLLSAAALMIYLCLLTYMKIQVGDRSTNTGDEVYFFTGFVLLYLVLMMSVFLWLHRRKTQ
jgi:cation transport ATPase